METTRGLKFQSEALTSELLKKSDCVAITTRHTAFDMDWIVQNSQLIVDLRNAVKVASAKVYKL